MTVYKYIDRICIAIMTIFVLICILLMSGKTFGIHKSEKDIGYKNRLFDTSKVHQIDIVMNDWEEFIENCQKEEYTECAVVIDGKSYKNVVIRGKGNMSLTDVPLLNSNRYSFKIEFDYYNQNKSYYGLDKLNLNNCIYDNTFMKDYLTYQFMRNFDVTAPLCSYTYITVNGEDWGLYLAVEEVEDSFLKRNYGNDYGKLYKPDNKEGIISDDLKLKYIDDNYKSYDNIFDNAITDSTNNDKIRLIESLRMLNKNHNIEKVIDTEKVMRYFIVHNFVCNNDSYTGSTFHNYYLYEKNGKLSIIPWDYNLAFGGYQSIDTETEVNCPINFPILKKDMTEYPMLNWIFHSAEYTDLYYKYYSEFINNTDFSKIIDDTALLISPYVEKSPITFCTHDEFEIGVNALKNFCILRSESIKAQLNGDIPKTLDEQLNNKKQFIDTSMLSLSDMGKIKYENNVIHKEEQMPTPENISDNIHDSIVLLASSIAVLILGLVFVFKFKR